MNPGTIPKDAPRQKINTALAGNPNCGKTTVFNALTGARQRVGNWPGVTVERMEGAFQHAEREVNVIDLPGIYAFSALSIDESISREYILRQKPDVVVNILDASNLERNLYLTTQLLEMHVPVVVALNMMDVVRKRRIRIEVDHLAGHLGCPVIPIVASKGQGMDALRDAIVTVAEQRQSPTTGPRYDSMVEDALVRLMADVEPMAQAKGVSPRWLGVRLLERDELAKELTEGQLIEAVESEISRIEKHTGDDIEIVIADGRYGFIHGLTRDVVHRGDQIRRTISDGVDRVILNRALGIPLFFLVMYGVFFLTVSVGKPFIDFFDILCGTLFVDGFGRLLELMHAPAFLVQLLADGVGGGIQTVSTFVPPIFFIFLCLSILEDSGYMARAAFVMDRVLRAFGLPGKAFLPMLVGFGCNVPGIMATRTLETRRDRILTALINPFMSCGARLPVYTFFTVAFFPNNGGTIVFAIYMIGIALGVLTGLLFKRTVLTGEAATFVMELPPYHIPTLSGIMYHTWHKLKSFIVRAGRVILVVVVLMSLLNAVGTDGTISTGNAEKSIMSATGRAISPIFRPMGIGEENWPAVVGLFTGIFAKEAVVGTLDTLYTQLEGEQTATDTGEKEPFALWAGVAKAVAAVPAGFRRADSVDGSEPDDGDSVTFSAMHKYFNDRQAAFAYLLFILIYAPCLATIAAIYTETGWRWTLFGVSYLTVLAWLTSVAFYQAATFERHPDTSMMWLTGIAATLLAGIALLKLATRKRVRPC